MNEDTVTGLLAWPLFEDRIDQMIKQSERYQFTMGLMCVDVDDFDLINHALGEEVGNQLLSQIARRLEECIRRVDSVSRWRKDTFVILLTQLAKPETAVIVAQRVMQALSQPFQINEHELYITVGVGVSLHPNDGGDRAILLQKVEHALHLAKAAGQGCCRYYEENMQQQSQHTLQLYNSLSRDSVFDEFSLLFQPVVDVLHQKVLCMDAHLLWQHPALGLVNSEALLECADRQHKSNAISEWLLRQGCKQFLAWKADGVAPQLLGMPLSIKQLENSRFVYQLSLVLQQMGMPAENLLVEIKDNASSVSFDILEKAFNMFDYLGVKLAIDGFGVGFFNLSHLKKMRIHYIKLDRQFVDDVVQNAQTQALVKSVLFLAQTMGIQVIIQGVETDQQKTLLRHLGVELLQGPFFGEPMSADKVINQVLEEKI